MAANIVFQLRGLCDRTGFDTSYMVINDETNGMMYWNKIYSVILENVAYVWQSNIFDDICACHSDIRHNEYCFTKKNFGFGFWVMCGFLNCLNSNSLSQIESYGFLLPQEL